MLKVYNDFARRPDLLQKFEAVAACYSASCVFADVQYRLGVMASAIRPAFPAKIVGQALTVQLSKGDLVDPLKALEMGQPSDLAPLLPSCGAVLWRLTVKIQLPNSLTRAGAAFVRLRRDHIPADGLCLATG